jgi:hypothetical protein
MKPNFLVSTFCFVLIALSCQFSLGQDVSGNWSGRWHSAANNHSGKISATFCQSNHNTMRTQFRGTFAKVIPFRYTTNLTIASQSPGLTVLSGSRRLPLGGEFNYYVTMTDQCFHGTFSSKRNRGTFIMSRK